jgi:glycine/D-amino acid oxidase-like deaminating enzyme
MRDKAEIAASIEHWERLATESEAQAQWDRDHGIDLSKPGGSAGDHKAQTYRRTAEALRREMQTGLPHCTACLGAHPNHHHGHRG